LSLLLHSSEADLPVIFEHIRYCSGRDAIDLVHIEVAVNYVVYCSAGSSYNLLTFKPHFVIRSKNAKRYFVIRPYNAKRYSSFLNKFPINRNLVVKLECMQKVVEALKVCFLEMVSNNSYQTSVMLTTSKKAIRTTHMKKITYSVWFPRNWLSKCVTQWNIESIPDTIKQQGHTT